VLPAKRQVIARSRGTDPEPAVPAWAHGTDGVGPALLSPDGALVRWLLWTATYTTSATTRTTRPGRKAAGRRWMASADLARNARQPDGGDL